MGTVLNKGEEMLSYQARDHPVRCAASSGAVRIEKLNDLIERKELNTGLADILLDGAIVKILAMNEKSFVEYQLEEI